MNLDFKPLLKNVDLSAAIATTDKLSKPHGNATMVTIYQPE
jgi:hypothetical protein